MKICSMYFGIFQNEIHSSMVFLGIADFQRKYYFLHANVLCTGELFVLTSGSI